MKTKKFKQFAIAGIALLLVMWTLCSHIWRIRGDQYREYSARCLQSSVDSTIVMLWHLVEDPADFGGPLRVDAIKLNFYETDTIRRVTRNTYLKDDPGGVSLGQGIWMECYFYICELEEDGDQSTLEEFCTGLNAVCKEYIDIFKQHLTINELEYYLLELEGKLEECLAYSKTHRYIR